MLSPALPLVAPSLRASLTPPKTRTILPTGLAELDACLPGGGWPQGGLVELVQGHRPHPFCRQATWSLLLPALQQLQRPLVEGDDTNPGWLGWVGDGGVSPYAPSLAAQGLDMHRFIWIVTNRGDTPVAAAWAAEQLLRCESVQAVVLQGLAATPQAPSILRRLHYSAQANEKYLWVIRPVAAAQQASPAVLRLQWCVTDEAGLHVGLRVLKATGHPVDRTVLIPQASGALQQVLQAAQAMRRWRREEEAAHTAMPQREYPHAVVGQSPRALVA
ncbi:MAG: hypothetical protein ACO3GJ_04625 [Burkholderiaceae bacterium]